MTDEQVEALFKNLEKRMLSFELHLTQSINDLINKVGAKNSDLMREETALRKEWDEEMRREKMAWELFKPILETIMKREPSPDRNIDVEMARYWSIVDVFLATGKTSP